MSNLIKGDFQAKAVKPELGGDKQGRPTIRVEMEIVGGEHNGQRVPYDGKLSQEYIKYTRRDMVALGWKGKDVRTFVADVTAAKLTVPIRVEVAEHTYQDTGKTRQWSTVRSIGLAVTPLSQLDADKIADVNSWFAEANETNDDSLPF